MTYLILQHSGGSCGQPKKSTPQSKIFSYAMRMHVPRASLNTVTPFPQASVPAELRSLGWAEPDEAVAGASAAATAWRQRPPQWPLSKAPVTRTGPSSAFAASIPELPARQRRKKLLDAHGERLSMRFACRPAAPFKSPLQQGHQSRIPIAQHKKQQEGDRPVIAAGERISAHR